MRRIIGRCGQAAQVGVVETPDNRNVTSWRCEARGSGPIGARDRNRFGRRRAQGELRGHRGTERAQGGTERAQKSPRDLSFSPVPSVSQAVSDRGLGAKQNKKRPGALAPAFPYKTS